MQSDARKRLAVRLRHGSWASFVLALFWVVRAFWIMDFGRLIWEGGEQYFQEQFPFIRVWIFSLLGFLLGIAGLCVSRVRWIITVCAALANGLLLFYNLRRYDW